MIIAFQIIALITLVIGFIGSIGAKTKDERYTMLSVFLASVLAFISSVMFL